jgi:Protein of unknown function (DUF664)
VDLVAGQAPQGDGPGSATPLPHRSRLPIDVADRIFDRVSLDDIERCERATYSFRWILIHLIEEYPRHCGHADLLRQAIDGATGD